MERRLAANLSADVVGYSRPMASDEASRPARLKSRRKELVRHLHKVLETHRMSIRNVRRDANDAAKKLTKEKKISEDDEKRAHDDIQKLTDREIEKLEQMSKAKEKEIMEL